jgi:hypothetical protein
MEEGRVRAGVGGERDMTLVKMFQFKRTIDLEAMGGLGGQKN